MKRAPLNIYSDQPSILGVGLIALDWLISDDKLVPPRYSAGGTCGNVLTVLSYLGWRAFPVARLNGDAASVRVQNDLQRWGVELNFVNLSPASQTPIIVQELTRNKHGLPSHRFSWVCPKCGSQLPRYLPVRDTSIKDIVSRIGGPEVCFLDRVSRGALTLAAASAQQGALVVLELAGVGDLQLLPEALMLAHIVKYSEDRADLIAEHASFNNALLEVETRGHFGLRFRSRIQDQQLNEWYQVDAFDVPDVRDTAGAGDWCTAGVIHALGQNGVRGLQIASTQQLLDAVACGQALAAWNCRYEGARGGMYCTDRGTFDLEFKKILAGQGCQLQSPGLWTEPDATIIEELCPGCVN